jgi:hypothetical protein
MKITYEPGDKILVQKTGEVFTVDFHLDNCIPPIYIKENLNAYYLHQVRPAGKTREALEKLLDPTTALGQPPDNHTTARPKTVS